MKRWGGLGLVQVTLRFVGLPDSPSSMRCIRVELTNYLVAVDAQAAGSVYIVVEVTDVLGMTGRDSVKVTIIS
jgi:hypothetical protein